MSTLIQLSPASGITVGTTAVTSGTVGRVFFQGTGNVVQQDSTFAFDSTLKRLTLRAVGTVATDIPLAIRNTTDTFNLFNVNGLGRATFSFDATNNDFIRIDPQLSEISMLAYGGLKMMSMTNSQSYFGFGVASYKMGVGNNSPQARLDVRAQGALSTDIAFRVRNSGDTINSVEYNGDGSKYWRAHSGDMHFQFDPVNSRIHLKRTGTYLIQTDNAVTELQMICNAGNLQLRGGTKQLHIYSGGNFHLGGTALLAGSGDGNLIFQNGTAPSTNLTDRHYYYSADITAGNAAPHFRTENGSIIKLYQQSSAGITTVADLVTVLTNLGLLA